MPPKKCILARRLNVKKAAEVWRLKRLQLASSGGGGNTSSTIITNNTSSGVKDCSYYIADVGQLPPDSITCLICHDKYANIKQRGGGPEQEPPPFVSKLPSSSAPTLSEALGKLILRSRFKGDEKQKILEQLETALYCTDCMKQLQEVAGIFEQYEKLGDLLHVKRMAMISQLQSHPSTTFTKKNKVVVLRAKLIAYLKSRQTTGGLNPTKLREGEEKEVPKNVDKELATASHIVNGRLLRQRLKSPTKSKPQVTKKNSLLITRGSKRTKPTLTAVSVSDAPVSKKTRPPHLVVVGGGPVKETEIWEEVEQFETLQVKIENEDDDDEKMEVLDQDQDHVVNPESMFMDNNKYDDDDKSLDLDFEPPHVDSFSGGYSDDSDSEFGIAQPLVKITSTPDPRPTTPPPVQLQKQQLQPPQVISIKVLRCTQCMDLFMTQSELDQHHQEHEPCRRRPPLTCKCNLCGQVCNYKSILHHLKTVHYKKTEENNDEDEEMSVCPNCGKTVKDLPHHTLFAHQVTFSCDACSQAQKHNSSIYKDYKSYRIHLSTKHAAELGSHKCVDCGKSFIGKLALVVHSTKMHNQDFQHVCTQCQQRFRQDSGLQNHIKGFHDKTCHICDAKFSSRGILTDHLLKHAGKVDRKYKCDQCTKSFTTSAKLKDHVDAIHGFNKEAYVCDVCGKGFPIQNYLYIHLRSHETPEEKEARRLKAKAAAQARKLSGKPVLVSKGRPRIRPIQKNKCKKSPAKKLEVNIAEIVEGCP